MRKGIAIVAIGLVSILILSFLYMSSFSPINADPDGDGLSTTQERALGTDPHDPDTDNDGLSDGEEVNKYGTSPVDFDTDGDGLGDGEEVNKYGTDPKDPDTDNDGLSDGEEVKSYGTNPKKADTDGDGLNDRVEVKNFLTDPNDPDTDDDGLIDGDEVYKYKTDPKDKDSDDDGLFDGEEIEKGTNPHDPDTDNDGYKDGDDYFPLFDGYLKIHMDYWKEWRTGDTLNGGDPYFEIYIYIYQDNEWMPYYSTTIDVQDDISEAWDLFTLTVNIPDNIQYVFIVIDAWDADFDADDHYDLNGEDPSKYALEIEFNVLSGKLTVEGNGLLDGEEPTSNLTDAYAKVTVEIIKPATLLFTSVKSSFIPLLFLFNSYKSR
ncbi:MAG: hypothetical protein ACTSUJ_07735 [Candidatus Njordarchaeales archaeon]